MLRMVPRPSDAVSRDVPGNLRRVEYASHIALEVELKRKECSVDGCANKVVKGGVCGTHGAKRKDCSFEGCTNQHRRGEFVSRMARR